MHGLFRPIRLICLLGLVLLIGTVAGAGWMLNNSEGGSQPEKAGPLPFDGKFIIAFAYVDVEPGITRVYPLQPGRVEWVAAEGTFVKKGEELLRLESKVSKLEVAKAEIAVKDAKTQLAEAELLTKKHEKEVAIREAGIKALKAEKLSAEHQSAKVKSLFDKDLASESDKKAAEEQVKKVVALIDAEEKKLEMLKELGPEENKAKIERASLNVLLKSDLLQQAKLALQEFTVLAPVNGSVLRVHTSVGESLGTNPKAPALEFCPDLPRILRAEVLQEWANNLKIGQEVLIEDDTSYSTQWKGKVARISDWYSNKRSIIQEPFQFNDVRTLECIIQVTEEPQGKKLKIGQRMRVMINQGGP
jgi:multidrug resistance efflux pump